MRWNRVVEKKVLVNKINFANFQGLDLAAYFVSPRYNRELSLKVKPRPCAGDTLDLDWVQEEVPRDEIGFLRLEKIIVPDNGSSIVIAPETFTLTETGFSVSLPDNIHCKQDRKHKRFPAENIDVHIIQNSILYTGRLADFSETSFRIILNNEQASSFKLLNSDIPAIVTIKSGSRVFYSGECSFIRSVKSGRTRSLIMTPVKDTARRFRPKTFRSDRYRPASAVHAIFSHPLSGKINEVRIFDISGSGFSVIENEGNGTLIPGMIIPDVQILLPGAVKLPCTVQIIGKHPVKEGLKKGETMKGCAILDMNPKDVTRLLTFIHQTGNSHSFINSRVDLDDLWHFFFDSGFIYPEKYTWLLRQRDAVKETYRKLYREDSEIGRYFVHLHNGSIRAHMAMARVYRDTWLLHHHAASPESELSTGLTVLNQAGNFTNSCHRIQSMHMDYLMCYYRPENRFPDRVFGSVARETGDPQKCSLDTFAYFHTQERSDEEKLPDGWSLSRSTPDDVDNLNSLYRSTSGGLMTEAFNVTGTGTDNDDLVAAYRESDLERSIQLYSLRHEGRMKALFMADISPPGLNLSELTNCIKAFITDDDITKKVFDMCCHKIAGFYSARPVPVLLYPHSSADSIGIEPEKSYNLWVLNMDATDAYFTQVEKIFRSHTRH